MALINGNPWDDGVEGTGDADTINGLGGNDVLVGLAHTALHDLWGG